MAAASYLFKQSQKLTDKGDMTSSVKVVLAPEHEKLRRAGNYGSFAGPEEVGVKLEEFRAVTFHDVEYSVRSLLTCKTKKILLGVRYFTSSRPIIDNYVMYFAVHFPVGFYLRG